jgi:transposase
MWHRRRYGNYENWCGTGRSWWRCARGSRPGCTQCWPSSQCLHQTRGGTLHIGVTDLFGVGGRQLLEMAGLDGPYRARVHAQLRLIDAFGFEIDTVSRQLGARLCQHHGYQEIQRIPGIGPLLAAVFVAEIGEVDRFGDAAHLVSWAGLTPKHRESDTTVRRGPITKQGSGLVRWAAVEAAQKIPASAGWLVSSRARIAERRGRNIATVATARKLLTLVYYGLRDGHIHVLAPAKAAA